MGPAQTSDGAEAEEQPVSVEASIKKSVEDSVEASVWASVEASSVEAAPPIIEGGAVGTERREDDPDAYERPDMVDELVAASPIAESVRRLSESPKSLPRVMTRQESNASNNSSDGEYNSPQITPSSRWVPAPMGACGRDLETVSPTSKY